MCLKIRSFAHCSEDELANSNDNYLMQRNFTLAFGLKNYNFVEIGRQDTMLVWYPSMVTLFGHTFAELRICQCLPSKLNSDVNHIWMSIHGWMHLDFLDACILDFLHSWCPEFLNFLSCCLLVDVGWLLAQNQKWLLRRLVHPMTKSRIQEWQKKEFNTYSTQFAFCISLLRVCYNSL